MRISSFHFAPCRGSIVPLALRTHPPFHLSWFSHSFGYPMPGLVSTLLNQAYSMPGRLVQTFLQVTEQVWQPMHLSRLSTMPIWARIFMLPPAGPPQRRQAPPRGAANQCERAGSCDFSLGLHGADQLVGDRRV